jgi:hydroxymethylglutaryl-CoA lyase
MNLPERVRIVEVGPRDGLQNEGQILPTAEKLHFIEELGRAGLVEIEASSFVHPKLIPQLADADELFTSLAGHEGTFSALVPNARGLDRAQAAGVKRIAVFTAASETFTTRNIRMSIDESLEVFAPVIERAIAGGMSVRGYLSTCFVCPYEGDIPPAAVRPLAERLLELGCDEVGISDTIGAAGPREIHATVSHLLETIPVEKIALHLHDTFGTALANVLAGLELGVTSFDAAAGGLGGCPYAPGAAGNLATEDLIYMLDRCGIETGADLTRVTAAGAAMAALLGRTPSSRQWKRLGEEALDR